jgi:hypothetical protein
VLSTDAELAIALEAQEVGDSPAVGGALVDMGARRVDPAAAIERAAAARLPVIAVAQHDDQLTRRRALAAGAIRVFSYNKFFTDGTRLVERWLTAADPPAKATQAPGVPGAPAPSRSA